MDRWAQRGRGRGTEGHQQSPRGHKQSDCLAPHVGWHMSLSTEQMAIHQPRGCLVVLWHQQSDCLAPRVRWHLRLTTEQMVAHQPGWCIMASWHIPLALLTATPLRLGHAGPDGACHKMAPVLRPTHPTAMPRRQGHSPLHLAWHKRALVGKASNMLSGHMPVEWGMHMAQMRYTPCRWHIQLPPLILPLPCPRSRGRRSLSMPHLRFLTALRRRPRR